MRVYDVIRPLLFRLPAETAHDGVRTLLRAVQSTPVESFVRDRYSIRDDRLATDVFGASFPNPIGVAAGFDKNAEIPAALASLGFGHVEIGGVTANAQFGNPRPRMFRLPEDEALINRMGFNNHGADRIAERLDADGPPPVPLGVNIGKSKRTPLGEAADDYRYSYEQLAGHGDFFVVNVSSPNTPGLRSLQHRDGLSSILGALKAAGAAPLLVKLSPDLAESAIEDVLTVVDEHDLDGIIAVNTTVDRPGDLRSRIGAEDGGLSGRPLEPRATDVVRFVAERTRIPVIGVGGVFTAEDAYRKLRNGAHLVQLYTGLVYRGPSIARDINRGLIDLLERDGFDSVDEVVGVDLDRP